MDHLGQSLLCCLTVWWLGISSAQAGALPPPMLETYRYYDPKHEWRMYGVAFEKSPRTVKAALGSFFKLSCSLHVRDVDSPPKIIWWRGDAPVQLPQTLEKNVAMGYREWMINSELIFSSVDFKDIGSYTCKSKVKGQEYKSNAGNFMMYGVGFQTHPQQSATPLNVKAALSCSFRARPVSKPAKIVWWKDGFLLKDAQVVEKKVFKGRKDWVTNSILTINSVDYTDIGTYKCIALVEGAKIHSEKAYLAVIT